MTTPTTELRGWGRATRSRAVLREPGGEADLVALLSGAGPRGALARGSGLAYGDAAQNAGGLVLATRGLTALDDRDLDRGELTAEAGATMWDVVRRVVPRGWMLPVVPGTRLVTVGGAIASDVHGKGHHRDGSVGAHVRALELATPDGPQSLDPEGEPEFWGATVGGLGLTGVVRAARLGLRRIETAWMSTARVVTRDLDDTLAALAGAERTAPYAIAWLDLLGRRPGRGVVERGAHARRDELPDGRDALRLAPAPVGLRVPDAAVPVLPLARRATLRAANDLRLRRLTRGPSERMQRLEDFFWPLDAVPGWSRLHGPRGLVQYQLALPHAAADLLRRVVARLARPPLTPTLVTLKSLGDHPAGPLSFPLPGLTLAVDLPAATPGLAGVLDELDELAAGAGGRVYLTKDARLRPDVLAAMYPRLEEWRAARARLDPRGTMRSDLARRLALT